MTEIRKTAFQVSFCAIDHNKKEIWIQHPDLDQAIAQDDFDLAMEIADTLTHEFTGWEDVELELDKIYDADGSYSIELWDYSYGPVMLKQQLLEAA